jgi:hypothetical protein
VPNEEAFLAQAEDKQNMGSSVSVKWVSHGLTLLIYSGIH